MNDVNELPNWAGQALQTGSLPTAGEPPRRGGGMARKLLIGLLALLLLGGVGAAGYWLATQQDDDEVATDAATATTDATASDDTTAGDDVTTDDAPAGPETSTDTTDADTTGDDTGDDTTTDDGTTGDGTDGDGAADPGDGELVLPADYTPSDPNFEARVAANTRYTVLKGGQVFFYGYVPDADLEERLIAVASGVVGPDNVFSEYIIDPDTPEIDDGPVFVDDRVLFGFNSVAIEPVFVPILDLGVLLLSQNPTATITVVSRTDAVGSESINQEVSEQRAQAVVDYWASNGISPDRITIDARGESDASENDDDQTAALNRSVEFRVANLFPEE